MMTVKLYDTDSHIRQFTATVTACRQVADAKSGRICYEAELDRTAFFAEGGGQAADRGTITDPAGTVHQVKDVQEKDEQVFHVLDEPLSVGETVTGEIDWDFRFDNMQQHSGEHILSGLCYAWKGYHNVGFHLGEAFTTIDFDGPLTPEEILTLEMRANEVVYRNIPITVRYPSEEELSRMDYRSKKALTGSVRIVQVGDYDLCACCAPHVMLTGEIGLIKIIRYENYKGGMRLTILCGGRAIRDYQEKNELIYRIAAGFSTKPEKIQAALEKQQKETEETKERLLALSRTVVQMKKQQLAEEAAMQGGSVSWVEDLLDPVAVRSLLSQLVPLISGTAAVLMKKGEQEFSFIVASSTQDARITVQALKERFGARGGGSAQMAQGSVSGKQEDILEFLRSGQ